MSTITSCRLFALSDPKEPAFQVQSDHEHKDSCDRCHQMVSTRSEIDAALIVQKRNMLPGVYEELSFSVRHAKTNILAFEGSYTALYQPRFFQN